MIQYQIENSLDVEEFRNILKNSTLGERRPIDDEETMKSMVQHGNLIVTARHEGKLVGVARSLTDFRYCAYLSDLAVDSSYQRQGIGKELIRHTKLAAPLAKIILIAAPKAIDYYPAIGMTRHEHCYFLDDVDGLR
ncbi:MAG: GNAT family N-acetyltransferase [Flavobacteriales bacterium]|nr:GNAT family N-acetyltransferase [Flavobacteriales bacterium]